VSDDLIVPTLIMLRGLAGRARSGLSRRTNDAGTEEGASTLEMVIITLGLSAVATILVTAITVAVTRRANQIK